MVFILCPALVYVISVFALRAAKYGFGSVGFKDFIAVFADFKRILLVRKHKAGDHLCWKS